jgi:hypothetical protein
VAFGLRTRELGRRRRFKSVKTLFELVIRESRRLETQFHPQFPGREVSVPEFVMAV